MSLLLALAPVPAGAEVTIEMRGIEGDLAGSARANLELQQYVKRDATPSQLRRLVERGQDEIRLALEPYGYYQAQVTGTLASSENGKYKATFVVTPGARTIIRDESVVVSGPAGELPAIKELIEHFEPGEGEALDHYLYELNKGSIAAALQTTGFFDAELTRHRVEVTRAAGSAAIDLAWTSGARYHMGDVHFTGAQFPEEFMRRYLPWKTGDEYNVERLLLLQQRLVDADYFTTVSVLPSLEDRANGTVPVEVLLVPAKRTIYTASAFVSTDTGPGARVGLERRWLNDRGHKAGGQVEYSSRLQSYSTFYRIPRPGLESRLYSFAAGYRDETTDSTRSRLARLSANEAIDDWHGYARTLGLQYLNGDFTVADEQHNSSLLFAEAFLTRKRADDLLFPSRGVSVTYTARAGLPGFLSDTSFAQLRADLKWVRPAGSASRVILRASGGALTAGNFDALPPELRFFAGGDRSVRGFDYQEIGERKAGCLLSDTVESCVLGGRYLITGSVEYEHYFLERWGAAVFVDTGDAFNSSPVMNVGAGIGVRWKSPVGVVRVDFGVPVRTDLPDNGLRLHIMIGPDL